MFAHSFIHSFIKALVRSGSDVGWEDLAHNQCFSFTGLQGLSAGHYSSSTPNSSNHVFMDLAIMLKQERAFPKGGRKQLSEMPLYAVALLLTATNKSKPWKTASDHYSCSTKPYCWHYAFQWFMFSLYLPNPDSYIRLPDSEARFITPENMFPLLQSPVTMCFTLPLSWHCDV